MNDNSSIGEAIRGFSTLTRPHFSPGLLLQDGMHPSAKGVDAMVERILPVVEGLLAANPDNS